MKLGLGLGLTNTSQFNKNPILKLDNTIIYLDAQSSAKNFTSGVIFDQIDSLHGSVAHADDNASAADRPEYDSAAFDGTGGISVPDADTRLFYGAFTAGSTHTIGMVLDIPGTCPTGSTILGFTNSSGVVDNQAKLWLDSSGTGRINWSLDQDSLTTRYELPWTASGVRLLLLLEIEDNNTGRLYLNDWSSAASTSEFFPPALTSFDPRDDFNALTYMSLFRRGTGDSPAGLKLGALFHTDDLLSAAERSSIETYWKSRFNVA